eukprot:EG_transcript_13813
MASLAFGEDRARRPHPSPSRLQHALDSASASKDLIFGRTKDPDFGTSGGGRRRVQPANAHHLSALPSTHAPWGQTDRSDRRAGKLAGSDGKGSAPWDRDEQQLTLSKKPLQLDTVSRDRQGRGHAGVPWGDDTVPKPQPRKVTGTTPYYTEDTLSRMMEVAKTDPILAQPKKVPAPSQPPALFEVWDKGECVHIAEDRSQAQGWARAHHVRGADIRPVAVKDSGESPPPLKSILSPRGEDPAMSKSAKSLSQVTFNPQITYSETPRVRGDDNSDLPKTYHTPAKFGRRAAS